MRLFSIGIGPLIDAVRFVLPSAATPARPPGKPQPGVTPSTDISIVKIEVNLGGK